MTSPLSARALRFFEDRRICPETASKYGVHSGSCAKAGAPVVLDPGGSVLVFPYIDGGREVSAKYRAAGKVFWQREGGRRNGFTIGSTRWSVRLPWW